MVSTTKDLNIAQGDNWANHAALRSWFAMLFSAGNFSLFRGPLEIEKARPLHEIFV